MKTTVVKPKSAGTVTVEIPENAVDDAIAGLNAGAGAVVPAFPSLNRDEASTPAYVKVWRLEPEDGYLGQIPADGVSEQTLASRFGGYLLEAECVGENGRVMPGGKKRQFRINAPPVATHIERAAALERKTNGGAPSLVNSLADVDKLLQMQTKSFDERIALLKQEQVSLREERKAEQDAQLAKIKAESDAYIAKMKAEADERERREQTRHTNDLERERLRSEAAQKQHETFLVTMQNTSSKSTDVVVAALNSSKSGISELIPLITAFAPMLGGLMGGGDPSVQIANSVSRSIEGIANIASGTRNGGKEDDAGDGAKRKLPAGEKKEGAPGEDKQRILGKVATLFKAVKSKGHDVEKTLDDAIAFYTTGKVPEDPGGDEVDESEETEETTGDAKPKPKRRGPRVARSGRVVARGAGAAPVGSGGAGDGTPDAPRNTRRAHPVSTTAKRSRPSAGSAALRATEHQVPARKA